MKRFILAYAIGLIFGVGISISGMANPSKVLNFFDIAGTWDPSLIFVMGGAFLVSFMGYRVVFRRTAPLLEPAFQLPTGRDIDLRLIGGSATFGVGWGIAGFCPGGALPALGTGQIDVIIFVISLVIGMTAARFIQVKTQEVVQG